MKRGLLVGMALFSALSICPVAGFAKDAPKAKSSPRAVTVQAYCPVRNVSATATGATYAIAAEAASKACLDKGGTYQCCYGLVRQLGS